MLSSLTRRNTEHLPSVRATRLCVSEERTPRVFASSRYCKRHSFDFRSVRPCCHTKPPSAKTTEPEQPQPPGLHHPTAHATRPLLPVPFAVPASPLRRVHGPQLVHGGGWRRRDAQRRLTGVVRQPAGNACGLYGEEVRLALGSGNALRRRCWPPGVFLGSRVVSEALTLAVGGPGLRSGARAAPPGRGDTPPAGDVATWPAGAVGGAVVVGVSFRGGFFFSGKGSRDFGLGLLVVYGKLIIFSSRVMWGLVRIGDVECHIVFLVICLGIRSSF